MATDATTIHHRPTSLKRQFATNAASGFVAQAVTIGVGLVTMPYLIGQLGTKAYGVSQIAQSTLAFFVFLQLGMAPTLVRYCSQAIARHDQNAIRKVSSTAQLILGTLGLLGMVGIIASIPFFLAFYDISPEMTFDVSGLLFCLAISFLFNFLFIVPNGLVLGSNRYDQANGIEIVACLLRLGLIFLTFWLFDPSLLLLGISILTAQAFRFFLYYIVAIFHTGRAALFSIRAVSRETLKSLFGFSSLNLIQSLAYSLAIQGPVLIVGKVLGTEVVAMFAPAVLIATAMQGFLARIITPLVPLASRAQAEGCPQKIGQWSMKVSSLVATIGLTVLLPLLVFPHELVELWLGPQMAHVWVIVVMMALGAIIAEAASSNFFLALGGGCIRPAVFSLVILGIIQGLGIVIGTTLLGWNLFQIVLFMIVCRWSRNVVYLPFAYSKQFLYSLRKFLFAVYIKPIAIILVSLGLGYAIKWMVPPSSPWLLGTEICAVLLFHCAVVWLTVLPEEIKNSFRKFNRATPKPLTG